MKIATLAIIVRGNEVLLGFKKTGEIGGQTLNGPGGKCEAGESLIDCILRETKEEVDVGLDPNHLEKVSVITFYAGDAPDFEVHIFRTETFYGEPKETKDMKPDWYDINRLPLEWMLESDREWFLKVIRGEKFLANVYYKKRAADFERIEFFTFV